MILRIVMTAGLLLMAACAYRTSIDEGVTDPISKITYKTVLGAMDGVGGNRCTELIAEDAYGRQPVDQWGRSIENLKSCGPGTLQGFMTGGFGGAMEGAGLATGMAVLRPATTTVSNVSRMSGGSASVAPGAAVASAPTSVRAVGRGGAGGSAVASGGAGGTGGSATSSPVVTATGGNPTAMGGAANAAGGKAAANSSSRSAAQSAAGASAGTNSQANPDANHCVGAGCFNN